MIKSSDYWSKFRIFPPALRETAERWPQYGVCRFSRRGAARNGRGSCGCPQTKLGMDMIAGGPSTLMLSCVPTLPAIARKLRGRGCQPNRVVPPCRLQGLEVESYHGEKTIVILNAR
jgi:hypothetical protein